METNTKEIVEEVKQKILKLAKENNLQWFYNLHQIEVVKSAEELLKYYPQADKEVVMLACWLHDIVHYTAKTAEDIKKVKPNHHVEGGLMAKKILTEFGLDEIKIEKVKKCVERHRNNSDYPAENIEEKILVAADSYSHLRSIFYFTYFKFHPEDSIDEMVSTDLAKLERDWIDIQIIPEAKKLAENKYLMLKELLETYLKDKEL